MGCDCHSHDLPSADTKHGRAQRKVLGIVTAINGSMAAIEISTGFMARSTALLTDALEMTSDTVTSWLARIGVRKSARWRGWSVFAKSGVMMSLGLFAVGWVVFRFFNPALPVAEVMTGIGALACAANTACAALLYKYRNDGPNMKSTFLCVRNDALANLAIIAAGLSGMYMAAQPSLAAFGHLPDIAAGLGIGGLFIKTASEMMRDAYRLVKGKIQDNTGETCEVKPALAVVPEANPKFMQKLKNKVDGIFNKKSKKPAAPAADACCDHDHKHDDHAHHDDHHGHDHKHGGHDHCNHPH